MMIRPTTSKLHWKVFSICVINLCSRKLKYNIAEYSCSWTLRHNIAEYSCSRTLRHNIADYPCRRMLKYNTAEYSCSRMLEYKITEYCWFFIDWYETEESEEVTKYFMIRFHNCLHSSSYLECSQEKGCEPNLTTYIVLS